MGAGEEECIPADMQEGRTLRTCKYKRLPGVDRRGSDMTD